MDFIGWTFVTGLFLLLVAVGSAYLRVLPASDSLIYLLVGLAVGPLGLKLISVDVLRDANWLERLTEVVLVVSLFVGGLKLRLPPRAPAWRAAFWLAGPVMVLSILGVALVSHLFLGLTLASALLLGAALAPTDPVLASEVSVGDAGDRDRLRYALSGEAGLNDGTAFPFVVLALGLIAQGGGWGGWVWGWAIERVLWAVPAGLGLGFALGFGLGRLAIWVRQHTRDPEVGSDLLLLALIALSYSSAEYIHAWGFLAVFAAGVGLRRAEVRATRRVEEPAPTLDNPVARRELPAEALLEPELSGEALAHPAVASGLVIRDVLSFGEVLERFLALGIVILAGVLVGPNWDWRGLGLALALFLVIRPAAVWLCLGRAPLSLAQRGLVAWLGIRGIGSLYYLAYAIGAGLGRERADEISRIVITVIAVSIFLHGISVTPLLGWYEKTLLKPSAGTQRDFRTPSAP